jgi:hypothetical protein
MVGANLKIIAADSAAAILDEKFNPLIHVATVAVLVEPPYREAQVRVAEPIFKEVEDGLGVVVHEAELCLSLLGQFKADVVHLDATLGGILVEELSPVQLTNMRYSVRARQNLLKILPKLRRVAGEAKRLHNADMIAIGKESLPVRIAELTAGAQAIVYVSAKVMQEQKPLLLGLPIKCQHRLADGKVYLHSLMEAEHDIRGYAADPQGVLSQVAITEIQNPVARGFRALRITPKP